MAYILDIAVILIFALCLFTGWRKGFVSMIIKLVGLVAAVLIAASLCGPLATWAYDVAIAEGVEQSIATGVEQSGAATLTENVQAAMTSLPDFIHNMLETQGISVESVTDAAEQTSATTVEAITDLVANQVVRPLLLLVLKGVFFIILVIILLIVVSIVRRLLKHVMRIPVLRQVDQVLGLLLGIVEGVLWVMIAVAVIDLIASTSAPDALISRSVVDGTLVTGWVLGFNPVSAIFHAAIETLAGVFG